MKNNKLLKKTALTGLDLQINTIFESFLYFVRSYWRQLVTVGNIHNYSNICYYL